MKGRGLARLMTAALLALLAACGQGKNRLVSRLGSNRDSTSYALGLDFGARYQLMRAELDLQALANGLSDTIDGKPVKISGAQATALRREFARAAFVRRNSDSVEFKPVALDISPLDTLVTPQQRMCYIEGVEIGGALLRNGVETSVPCLIQGIADTVHGQIKLLDSEPIVRLLAAVTDSSRKRADRARDEMRRSLEEKGKALLAGNAARPEVVTTRSGLQYEVLKPGSGKSPGPRSRVQVHFLSRLADSSLIEDSHVYDGPVVLEVDGMSKGLSEGLCLMKPGAVYRFVLPADLAYGDESHGKVPPNSVLLYEIELLKVL